MSQRSHTYSRVLYLEKEVRFGYTLKTHRNPLETPFGTRLKGYRTVKQQEENSDGHLSQSKLQANCCSALTRRFTN